MTDKGDTAFFMRRVVFHATLAVLSSVATVAIGYANQVDPTASPTPSATETSTQTPTSTPTQTPIPDIVAPDTEPFFSNASTLSFTDPSDWDEGGEKVNIDLLTSDGSVLIDGPAPVLHQPSEAGYSASQYDFDEWTSDPPQEVIGETTPVIPPELRLTENGAA